MSSSGFLQCEIFTYGDILHIMIFLAFGEEEGEGEEKGERFRNRDCPPYAVHAEE